MRQIIGGIMLILILVGLTTHMDGHVWVAMTFYVGGGVMLLALIILVFRRYW